MPEPKVRFSHVAVCVLAMFLSLEAGARFYVHAWAGKPFQSLSPFVNHPDGGYWNNPRYTHPSYAHNSAGFRNTEEYTLKKPPETVRILCIGHSTLYSGIADTPGGEAQKPRTDHLITSELERLLDADPDFKGRDFQVMNAGLNLASMEEMTSLFMNSLVSYEPDMVIIFGSANHFTIGPRPAPPFGDNFWRLNGPVFELLANDHSWRGLAEKSFRTTIHYSSFLSVAYRVLDRLLPRVASSAQMENDASKIPPAMNEGWIHSPEGLADTLRRNVAFLSAIAQFCDARGIKTLRFWEYFLVNLENVKPLSPREREIRDYLRSLPGVGGWANTKQYFWLRDEIKNRMQPGMEVIDLYDDFKTCDQTIFNDYLHYSEAGNEWVASKILPYVKKALQERAT